MNDPWPDEIYNIFQDEVFKQESPFLDFEKSRFDFNFIKSTP